MKNKNVFDLDPERLGTTDENGERIYLYPEEVKGKWKERRKIFYWFLIGLYLILPWFNINDKPALQIDIFNREFTFLGGTLHGVEPVLFFLLLASGLFFIAFITSLFGRVWCGWACPQTVFIQSIFWKIEEWTEGSARQRRQSETGPWTWNRSWRRVLKWTMFFLVSAHIAHTFIGYFVGPRFLLSITTHSPTENWGLFTATCILTIIFLSDFGWFREQFCIIACPYGRIQSVMMDENSLIVSYDEKRGEPRFGTVPKGTEGDCINCYHCVKVCPTGIDIRRGVQLECIHCTQCIDACDDIMSRLKKPPGLIKYSSENEIKGGMRKLVTPRSILYAVIGSLFIAAFFFFLQASTSVKMVFIRSKVPFTVTRDGKILNNFQLKLSHQGSSVPKVEFRLKSPDLGKLIDVITPMHPTILDQAEKKTVFFLRFDRSVLANFHHQILIEAIDSESGKVLAEREVTIVGPIR